MAKFRLDVRSPKDRPKNNDMVKEDFKKGAFVDKPIDYLKTFVKPLSEGKVTDVGIISRERGDIYEIITLSVYIKKE